MNVEEYEKYLKFREEFEPELDGAYWVSDIWELDKLNLALFGAHAKIVYVEKQIAYSKSEALIEELKEEIEKLNLMISTLNHEYLSLIAETQV